MNLNQIVFRERSKNSIASESGFERSLDNLNLVIQIIDGDYGPAKKETV